ncbi:uncharacterized protein C16orf96 homolog [Xenopus laevis]|uniref:Uncharacterized protein C16orf96 homolog n=2 Tax=Xenopus laevis TaxID=8355 RepID=A0A1L8EMZ4_XENLA|nr:uncharacterized protein C16orf96 homolog [Xenopus laevis]XP_041434633.1 uncharacterized protein C16orf96 homolog [Xenopus laevis]XP_041434634.1 uncharacterized protein C16orf96 homolog [Xenopus laevis]XP_041434635.1 uncharacterized protein C16orf96 homolog [Xenopus laevis]OCT60702.1 hypothetical protein XELAEV_18046723mg [Xenopus laevis]
MALLISLSDLANLSIGAPEAGTVNFNALRTLLHAIIKHLNIQDIKTEVLEAERDLYKAPSGWAHMDGTEQAGKVALGYHQMEERIKHIEKQTEAVNKLPTGAVLIERAGGPTPVEDVWHMLQMKKRIETNEEGVSTAMGLLQDLLNITTALQEANKDFQSQLQNVRESVELTMQEDIKKCLSQLELQRSGVEKLTQMERELMSLQQRMATLEKRLMQYPSPSELNNIVGWDILRETLVTRGMDAETSCTDLPAFEKMVPDLETGWTQTSDPAYATVSLQAVTSHAEEPFQTDFVFTVVAPPGLQSEEQFQEGAPCQTALDPLVGPLSQTGGDTLAAVLPQTTVSVHVSTDMTSTPTGGPVPPYSAVNTSISTHPTRSPMVGSPSTMPAHFPGMSFALAQVTDQPKDPAAITMEISSQLVSSHPITSATIPAVSSHGSSRASQRYADTVEALRKMGALTDKYSVLRERVEVLVRNKADRSELKAFLEGRGKLTVPDGSNNVASLQDEMNITRFMHEMKAEREKDGDLIGDLQTKMLTFQGGCERLEKYLTEEQKQTQRHIDVLYQKLEEMEDKKADKEHIELEIDVKADKQALDGKVSRVQFDATTEQLNNMVNELLGRVTGQEQDWQKVLEKTNKEMQNKLDRMELDPFKKTLEEHLKSISRQLQERSPQYEVDEAAGIRKQLISHFHCLSCDRPLDISMPGPPILTIPNVPGLPGHRSTRPQSVYELEQHFRNDRPQELVDYNCMSSARRCGGSHTLTYSHRHFSKLQNITPKIFPEEGSKGFAQKEEDILGLNGHIYRGRMDSRLPAIYSIKDGKSRTMLKLSQTSQKSILSCYSRPQSAKSAGLSPTAQA